MAKAPQFAYGVNAGRLMQGAGRDLVNIWQKMNAKRFDNIMLKTKTVGAKATPAGIEVTFAAAEEGGSRSLMTEAPDGVLFALRDFLQP